MGLLSSGRSHLVFPVLVSWRYRFQSCLLVPPAYSVFIFLQLQLVSPSMLLTSSSPPVAIYERRAFPPASPPCSSRSYPEVVEVSTAIERHPGSVTIPFRLRLRPHDPDSSPVSESKHSPVKVDSVTPRPADSALVVRPPVVSEYKPGRPSYFHGGVPSRARPYDVDHYRTLR